ncbi:MAG: response regulator [Phaeospirillum sp.]|nr:response regulator [Phaeospirillum sp.]
MESRPFILFVDDEQAILDGLFRSLSAMDEPWNMLFSTSGTQALELIARHRIDVIVSDLRMPGMDGAELLATVRRLSPETTRIILSGCSEREVPYQTVGPAHQHYTKPCSSVKLSEAINRALAVRRRLRSPEVLSLVSGTKSAPTVQKSLADLFAEIQSPRGSAASVARIIERDIGLTAQLLKFANSGFFRVAAPISDAAHAARLLGLEIIRALFVMGKTFETFRGPGIDIRIVNRLQERSLVIGLLARRIAAAEGMPNQVVEQAQCAGMLAHIGSLLLLNAMKDKVKDIADELDISGGVITDVERKVLGVTHADCGAALLDLWGFPSAVVEAVLFHHEPSQRGGQSCVTALTAVHAAQALVKFSTTQLGQPKVLLAALDGDHLRQSGTLDHVGSWGQIARSVLAGAG